MYKSVLDQGFFDFTEKKSRFIGWGFFVKSEKEALDKIEDIKREYGDANHNCYAYIIGEDALTQGYSDDGEPQGSAGIPMLEVLKKEEMRNVLVIGTRYFGGVLLGKGGLYRAYTNCAIRGLDAAKRVVRENFNLTHVSYNYNFHGKILNLLKLEDYKILEEEFTDLVSLSFYTREGAPIIKELIDITKGSIKIENKGIVELATINGKIMR